jgi:aminoacyl-histidine dipeptidase
MDNATHTANANLVKNLKPEKFFHYFAEIAAMPRSSGNTAKVADYLADFASRRGLECTRDSIGNVIIRKPAQNSSSAQTVILQAHQDMVCVKTPESTHDFDADPLSLVLDGDWLRADGTTLGADNGVGLAAILAILDSGDLSHPALEGLFTVDEETTMAGIKAVRADQLAGNILINIDSEDIGEAYVSCAAGRTYTLSLPVSRQKSTTGHSYARVVIEGLRGGHSGVEINQGRANAFVLLGRFLATAMQDDVPFGLCDMNTGPVPGKDNAIPSHAEAVVSVETDTGLVALAQLAQEMTPMFHNEFRVSDPGVAVRVEKATGAELSPLTAESASRLLDAMMLMPLGAIRFIQDTERMEKPYGELLVESSNNLGIVTMDTGEAHIKVMARGSVASSLAELENKIAAVARRCGGSVFLNGRTDGWEMVSPPSPVQELFKSIGWRLLGIHAGLECGTLVEAFRREGRTLDAISIGPDVKGGHTPQERLGTSSVQKCWDDLTEVLGKL